MQYRTIPRSGVRLSCISFGGMRIPTGEGIPEEQAIATVRRAVDLGVNYLETAPGYGNSEILIGKALKDGYRERTYVSTKSQTDSVDAMRAGVRWGTIGLVERLVAEIVEAQTGNCPVLVTGGHGGWVAAGLRRRCEHVPHLTLEGIARAVAQRP